MLVRMDSGFNIIDSSFSFFDGKYLEIGTSQRFRYSKTRFHGELLFVKEPTDEYAHDLVTIEALKKEFLLGFRLNHPGIVRYYYFENNRLFEEYIEGKTLRQLIDEDGRPLYQKAFVSDMTRQILEALKYLHSQGIAHFDLKPENIMIANLGNRIKIIDLSCAESLSGSSTPGFTKEYQAPEQIMGQGNISTDIYQLGIILKEITEGKNIEREWKKFIKKATANHPDNRFMNTEEAIKAIPSHQNTYRNWISGIVIGLIISGVLSVVINYQKNYKEDVKDNKQMSTIEYEETPLIIVQSQETTDEVLINIPQPHESPTPLSSLPSEIDLERMLSKKIEKKLDELYSVRVIPMYEKMVADQSYKFKEGRAKEFIDAYSKEKDNLMAYGEELKKEYPDQATFIDERVVRTFETKTSMLLLKLYPTDAVMSNNELNSQMD